ncbi:MAG: hypothetical protein J7L14_03985, partial [Candidatus Diapherotrites archaeon]|nr:hypothetical protein [Candidatus Diapherotrites archaeon]
MLAKEIARCGVNRNNVFCSNAMRGLIALFVFLFLITASFAWWNTAWLYRRELTIQNPNSSTLTDFQVRLDINSGNINDDFWMKINSDCN